MLLATRRIGLPAAHPASSVHREMEQLFGRLMNGDPGNGGTAHGWRPAAAVWDDADKVHIEMELPGVKTEDVDVTVHNGELRILGQRKAPEGERHYWVNDRVYGQFDRTITLPEDVDADSIDAQLAEGVLRLVLSKKPEAQPKKVIVKG